MRPATLFGAPLGYTPETLRSWINRLDLLWLQYAKQRAGLLEADLALMSKTFGAGASPKSIRPLVADLPVASPHDIALPETIAMRVLERDLITPEGRILLDVLDAMQRSGLTVVSEDSMLSALERASSTRSEWYSTWLRKQLEGTLSPGPIGVAVFLLINRSIDRINAFEIPGDADENRELAAVVLPVIDEFASAMGSTRRVVGGDLRSHWTFTQVTRFLALDVARDTIDPVREGPDFSRDQPATESGAAIYIRADRETHLIEDLAGRLAGHEPWRVTKALEELHTGYRSVRGRLLTLGLAHEEPSNTRSVLKRLQLKV